MGDIFVKRHIGDTRKKNKQKKTYIDLVPLKYNSRLLYREVVYNVPARLRAGSTFPHPRALTSRSFPLSPLKKKTLTHLGIKS